ncbi:hypothetical protein BN946_scf184888.g25 [Trametes cinnabarina]|uniref:Uncharacterized protein n=1 Tax=Pycnoporus cinnabarinus TaxID=5643 RepID=A0A060SNK6_PYCCI|nr:hypothetical protein BN946_scf184888.g25 [Trametes cinnabarina]
MDALGADTKKKRIRKKYSCSCTAFCHGRPVTVSKTTYFRHQAHAKVAAAARAVANGLSGKRKQQDEYVEGDGTATGSRKRAREAGEDEEALDAIVDHIDDVPSRPQSQRSDSPLQDPFADMPEPAITVAGPSRHHRVTVEDVPEEEVEQDQAVDERGHEGEGEQAAQAAHEGEREGGREREQAAGEGGAAEEEMEEVMVTLEDMKRALDFIKLLKGASLDSVHSGLDEDTRERLRNPPQEIVEIEDDNIMLSIELYVTLSNTSQHYYEDVRKLLMKRKPKLDLLSYHQVKQKVEVLTGIVPIINDMCIDSCVGFTGPYAQLDKCPKCLQPRYDELRVGSQRQSERIPRKQFYTMALGQEIQAVFRTPEGSESMAYLSGLVENVLEELEREGSLGSFDDISHGSRFWGAYAAGKISPKDAVVALSIDGAQLHRNKKSDCWIYVWVILSLGPDKHYRKRYVLPGAVIPGPNHPKDLDSFLFPGLYHLSALMQEGLKIWDAAQGSMDLIHVFLALILADGPAMALLSGMVGHSGRRGCRLYCPLLGRRKPNTGNYYPVMLRPLEPYALPGSCHDDISRAMCSVSPSHLATEYKDNLACLLTARTPREYEYLRRETGLTKPSIFSGLSRTFDLPGCFPLDYMHLVALNLTDLFLGLWRGTIAGSKDADECPWVVLQGDTWVTHGAEVARAAHFLPGSFDRPPRNITEKLNSGYKAKEFMTYFYGYGPALLRRHLPELYLRNFAKFVSAGRTLGKHQILKSSLATADALSREAEVEYEEIYYGRDPSRLHLVRPCIHTFGHGPSEVQKIGPLIGVTQYTIERTIGNLGQELRQHATPFANLSHRALLRCQLNSLRCLIPSLGSSEDARKAPQGAVNLGNGLTLLCPKDSASRWVQAREAAAFHTFLAAGEREEQLVGDPSEFSIKIRKYGRLRLANGQIARSAWKERAKPLANSRISRVVKVRLDGRIEIAEVQYFCRLAMNGVPEDLRTVAVVSLFGPRDEDLFERLYGTVWLSAYQGDDTLRVIDVGAILAVVAMVPDSDVVIDLSNALEPHYQQGQHYFLVEQLGLEISHRDGLLEMIEEDDS